MENTKFAVHNMQEEWKGRGQHYCSGMYSILYACMFKIGTVSRDFLLFLQIQKLDLRPIHSAIVECKRQFSSQSCGDILYQSALFTTKK